MVRHTCAALLALMLTLPACAADDDDNDHDRVNGSISIEAGEKANDLSTVNGSIRVADDATIEDAETVNGSITVGDGVTARSLETVNGAIRVGRNTRLSGGMSSVNGSLTLDENTRVSGDLANVNGRIELDRAQVSGSLRTTAGDIHVGRDSRVGRGIVVERSSGFSFDWGKKDIPEIVIGPGATVEGTLRFEREVALYVSDKATIGKVEGAKPIRFSGDKPPAH